MRNTLVACLLVVAARAQPSFLSCSQLCKYGIDSNKWGKTCNCAVGVGTNHDAGDDDARNFDQLDNKAIYYEPTDLYLRRHISFINPPFYIRNPTLKLKVEARNPNTKHLKVDHFETAVSPSRNNNIENKVTVEPKSLYLDVSKQNPVDINKLAPKEVTYMERLTEKEFSDYIDLHLANLYYDDGMAKDNRDILTKIEQKCNDSVQIVKQSLEEMTNDWPKSKGLIEKYSQETDNPNIITENIKRKQNILYDTEPPEKISGLLINDKESSVDINLTKKKSEQDFTMDATVASILTNYNLTENNFDKANGVFTNVNKKDGSYSTNDQLTAAINTISGNHQLMDKPSNSDLRNANHDSLGSLDISDLENVPTVEYSYTLDESNSHSPNTVITNSYSAIYTTEKNYQVENIYEANELQEQMGVNSNQNDEIWLKGNNTLSENGTRDRLTYYDSMEDVIIRHDTNIINKTISIRSTTFNDNIHTKDNKNIIKPKNVGDVNTTHPSSSSSELINVYDFPNTSPFKKEVEFERVLSIMSDTRDNQSFVEQANHLKPETKIVSKIITREFENDTVVSSVHGSHDLDTQNHATTGNNITIQNDLNFVESEANMKDKKLIIGRMYFLFDKVNIPARFVQNENGNISVGLDGGALCSKIFSEENKSILINRICNEI